MLHCRQNLFCTSTPKIYFRRDPLRTPRKYWPVCVCPPSPLHLGKQQPGLEVLWFLWLSKSYKRQRSFSYTIPPMAWGLPEFAGTGAELQPGVGGSEVAYPISSCLSLHLPMELRHNPTWLPYLLHHLLYLGEAPLNTALSRSSFEMPKSWEPMCAWRETARALCKAATAMGSKGKRERLFKRKVTRWQIFRHILTTTTKV